MRKILRRHRARLARSGTTANRSRWRDATLPAVAGLAGAIIGAGALLIANAQLVQADREAKTLDYLREQTDRYYADFISALRNCGEIRRDVAETNLGSLPLLLSNATGRTLTREEYDKTTEEDRRQIDQDLQAYGDNYRYADGTALTQTCKKPADILPSIEIYSPPEIAEAAKRATEPCGSVVRPDAPLPAGPYSDTTISNIKDYLQEDLEEGQCYIDRANTFLAKIRNHLYQ